MTDYYQDPGATASDAQDGNITSKIVKTITKTTEFKGRTVQAPVENIPLNEVGEYTISYNVRDSGGLDAPTVTRRVNIISKTKAEEKGPKSPLPPEYRGVYDKNNFWLVQTSNDEPTHSTTGSKDGYLRVLIANSTASSSAVSNTTGIGGLSPSKIVYSYSRVKTGSVTDYSSIGLSPEDNGYMVSKYISNTEAVSYPDTITDGSLSFELLTTKRSESYEIVTEDSAGEAVRTFIDLKVPSDIYQELQHDPGCGISSHYGWEENEVLQKFDTYFKLGGCPRGYAAEFTEGLFKMTGVPPWISSSADPDPWTRIRIDFPGGRSPLFLEGHKCKFLGNNTVRVTLAYDYLSVWSHASLYGGVQPTRQMKIDYIIDQRSKPQWQGIVSYESDTVSASDAIITGAQYTLSKMKTVTSSKIMDDGATSLNASAAGTGNVGTVRRGHRIGSMSIGWYSPSGGKIYTRAANFTMGSGAACVGSNASYYTLLTDPFALGNAFSSANNPATENYDELFDLALDQSPLVQEHKNLFRKYGKPGGQGRVKNWKLPYAGTWDMYSIVKEV